jgi:hypothetical protein
LKSISFALLLAAIAAAGGCSLSPADASAREWQRAECNKVIDREDRERCLKRAASDYGVKEPTADKAGKRAP